MATTGLLLAQATGAAAAPTVPIAEIGPAATAPTATTAHPLVWARQLSLDELDQHGQAELFVGAKWLDNWARLVSMAPMAGTHEQYLAAHRKAKAIFEHLRTRNPNEPIYWAANAGSIYNIGEMTTTATNDERMAMYETMVELTTTCVEKLDPGYAYCWLLNGVAYGRLSTTRGVLSSAFLADDIEDAWLEVMEINPPGRNFTGDPITVDTQYGLAVFYRMVPDHWLVKIITGTRGDKEKSVELMRKVVTVQPNRLELQKELAVALLCYGDDEDEPEAIKQAEALLNQILAGKFDGDDIRATDEIDKQHARELLDGPPERACGYSRDGFQDLSEEALQAAAEEHQ